MRDCRTLSPSSQTRGRGLEPAAGSAKVARDGPRTTSRNRGGGVPLFGISRAFRRIAPAWWSRLAQPDLLAPFALPAPDCAGAVTPGGARTEMAGGCFELRRTFAIEVARTLAPRSRTRITRAWKVKDAIADCGSATRPAAASWFDTERADRARATCTWTRNHATAQSWIGPARSTQHRPVTGAPAPPRRERDLAGAILLRAGWSELAAQTRRCWTDVRLWHPW